MSMFDNVKVHFAGTDYDQKCLNSLQLAKVNYRLFTVYPAIVSKKIGDDFTDKSGCVERQQRIFKHVILDSGLFTLMFGGAKGQKQTRKSLELWQDKTVEFIKQNNYNGTLVEIDCQKVLGVDEAWYFRKRIKNLINNRIINVFHYEDGKIGLDKLIDYSDYLAISVPELRIVKPKTFRQDVYKLASYIKDKQPDIDIHLLGCTDKNILKQCSFCSTADSSSWTGCYRFGHILGRQCKKIKPEIIKMAMERHKQLAGEEVWKSFTEKNKTRCAWELISAEISKKQYEYYAGSQD